MFNERAVCQAIIDCCCELHWPAKRLKIQVGGAGTAQMPDYAYGCTAGGMGGRPRQGWLRVLLTD
jgi:hypothetical protein